MEEEDFGKFLNLSLRYLSFRPRSRKEVENYLQKKKVSDRVVQLVISKLEETGFIDDQKFAQWFVEQRSRFNPRGKQVLVYELLTKGINRVLVDEAVSMVDESALIERLVARKRDRLKNLPARERRLRVLRYLQSRGFTWNQVKGVIDEKG